MVEATDANETTPAPPWSGCLIPVVAAVVLLGLGTCTVVTGLLQDRQIGGFTADRPVEFEELVVSTAERAELEAKLMRLDAAARRGEAIEESWSVRDLNGLLATRSILETLRSNTRIREITERGISVETSQELRKLGGGKRFLNGTFLMVPARSETNQWQLALKDIAVPGKRIPEGFLAMFRDLHMFRFDNTDKALQQVLSQIEAMELSAGSVLVRTRAGQSGQP